MRVHCHNFLINTSIKNYIFLKKNLYLGSITHFYIILDPEKSLDTIVDTLDSTKFPCCF